uniref:BZIP domain-containing protein n=1 Tax=Globisporangium ultimum (strain ATCC 200006 / CBS 805.95 / DAOM BR144) TaxID=431595 RepID=K3WXD7_GLOUD
MATQQEQQINDSSPSGIEDTKFIVADPTEAGSPHDRKQQQKNETTQQPSRWLQWESSNELFLDCADLPNASALEIRRRKNRDSMRRSRQRQRDELDQMKGMVAQLEQQYETLCMRTGASGDDATTTSANSAREAAYLDAIDLVKRLGAENLYLKASIQEQASWKLQLHRVLESNGVGLGNSCSSSSNSAEIDVFMHEHKDNNNANALTQEEMKAIFGFMALCDHDVKDVILDSTKQVQGVQNRLLDDLVNQQYVSSPRDRLSVLGWDVRRRMDGHEMEFAFVKRFPNVSAYSVMKKTWDADLKLDRFKKIKSETRRLDILQQVSANTYVLGRDVCFPDDNLVFRTVYLRFRMETSSELPPYTAVQSGSQPLCKNGYVIGTQSINPGAGEDGDKEFQPSLPCIEDHEKLVWADMTLWMEFFDVCDPGSGHNVCEVRWTGKTNYKSERHAYRSAADTLMGLLRWEALAIKPVVSIR